MAERVPGETPVLDASTSLTNPTAGTRLATTGALTAGAYDVRCLCGGSAPSIFNIRRRNAADSGNIGDQVIVRTVAGGTSQFVLTYRVDASEQVDVSVNAEPGVGNTMEAAIQAEKLA